MGAVCWL